MKCSICGNKIEPETVDGKVVWDEGNNAQPINDGRCCNNCNMIVVQRRINDCINERAAQAKEY